ncbi:MAG: hypothetical protein U5N53_07345 [Mycobacterium sp.]|nr:hypothetical protein [Mycobacterium sp.]
MIGLGMWLGLIMAFNVWFRSGRCCNKILNIVPGATDEEKAKLRPRALAASRDQGLLMRCRMLYCMVGGQPWVG